MMTTAPLIVVAGATGNLGARIVRALRARGARVRALVRPSASAEKLQPLEQVGAETVRVDWSDATGLAQACAGASCVVSAFQGLEDVILGTQTLCGPAV